MQVAIFSVILWEKGAYRIIRGLRVRFIHSRWCSKTSTYLFLQVLSNA